MSCRKERSLKQEDNIVSCRMSKATRSSFSILRRFFLGEMGNESVIRRGGNAKFNFNHHFKPDLPMSLKKSPQRQFNFLRDLMSGISRFVRISTRVRVI